MKKLFALLTVVLFSGFMMAQNTSSVNQSGSGNDADVDQTGNINGSTIIQNTWGTGHIAEVTQNGASNKSDLFQDQRGASAFIEQLGTSNTSGLKQSGPNNANVYQFGEGNVLGSYSDFLGQAFQKNGTSFADDNNILDLDQIGDFNKAGVWQEHHATAILYQDGNLNESKIYQSGAPTGNYNLATVEIYGNENKTAVHQFGDGNTALMDLGYYGGASSNEATFTQEGNTNTLETHLKSAENNYIDGKQDGDNNLFRVGIAGDGNNVEMSATGNTNRGSWSISSIWPSYSDGNDLTITQNGDNNLTNGAVAGDLNDITIEQTGNGNKVGTLWYGSDGVNIIGDSNTVGIDQSGNANSSLNTINGNNNSINVTQSN